MLDYSIMESVGVRAAKATKWSLLTQVISKLISPVTTLILAHILAPKVFGIIALVTMVTSFADMFSDAGFQKYLIQHEYDSERHYHLSCDVAFWTNMVVSFVLWCGITLMRDSLASLLGDPTIGMAIAVACASLPLTSATSVQTAVYQRRFDFKTLFYSRVGSSLLILIVSVPLALMGLGYWSMIIGTIVSNLLLAIWLTVCSTWKPSCRYSFEELRAMLSFSIWTLVEQFSIWITNWVGAFILGSMMNAYYLGLYNTSVSLVNAIIAIITGAINPVIFATLSRFQNDLSKFRDSFFYVQKCLAITVVPVAVAIFLFSDMLVNLYLGSQWLEAATFLGMYALASSLVVVFGHVCSNAYRSIGKPVYSLISQIVFLFFLVPSYIIGAKEGFALFSIIVPAARLLGCFVAHFAICKFLMQLSPMRMMTNLRWIYAFVLVIGIPNYMLINVFELGYIVQTILIIMDIVAYVFLCNSVNDTRELMYDLLNRMGMGKIVQILERQKFAFGKR